jgi:uncharacterized protein DUF6627
MKQRILDVLSTFALLTVLSLAAAILMPRAYADMIPTESTQPAGDRAKVKAMLERPEAVREMQKMGIPPEKAAARVDAMTDVEVSQLAGRLDALPAGGAMSTEEWLLVIVVILLVIIIL